MSDFYLNEWLRGFVDGCFQISVRNYRPFTFRFVFKIKLHKDDRPNFIHIDQDQQYKDVYKNSKPFVLFNLFTLYQD